MSHHFDTPTAREDSRINLLLASKSSGKLLPSTNVPFLCDRWAGMGLLKARVDAQSEAIREDSTSIRRVGLRFGNTSIIPLAQQPVNDPERDYRETQSGDSQRGCHLNIEDDEFSRERQNADKYDSLDLYDAVKTFHCLKDTVIEFHGDQQRHDHPENELEFLVV
jgi:hypothetical protein